MIHTAKQLKDKVKNMSGGNSEVAQALIRTYFMERFLERVSVSEYRNNFILKGGMLVASIVGVDMRATMDIDTTVKALPLNEKDARAIIERIGELQLEDGVKFKITLVKEIMEEFDYPGIRMMIEANLERMRQGSVAVSEYEGIVSPAYFIYKFTDDAFYRRYFHYLLRSCYKDEFMRLSGGIRVGQWDLPSVALENMAILIPPMKEQKSIANFLDAKCAEIDALTTDIQTQIQDFVEFINKLVDVRVVVLSRPLKCNIEWEKSNLLDWSYDETRLYLELAHNITEYKVQNQIYKITNRTT